MDSKRLDAIAIKLAGPHPRRGALALAAAVALAGLLGEGAAAGALACARDGQACDPKKPGQCCSGNCAKAGKRRRCKPTGGAQGCTAGADVCTFSGGQCPDNRDGSCFVLDNGKPFCALGADCFHCETGADCDRRFRTEGGKCIKNCPACIESGATSACVFPKPLEAMAHALPRPSRNRPPG
jgi:hypothetical protein